MFLLIEALIVLGTQFLASDAETVGDDEEVLS